MKYVFAALFAAFVGFHAYSSLHELIDERDHYLKMLQGAGRTLCEHRKAREPEWFKDSHCGCNGWSWTNDMKFVDVGVACITEAK